MNQYPFIHDGITLFPIEIPEERVHDYAISIWNGYENQMSIYIISKCSIYQYHIGFAVKNGQIQFQDTWNNLFTFNTRQIIQQNYNRLSKLQAFI